MMRPACRMIAEGDDESDAEGNAVAVATITS